MGRSWQEARNDFITDSDAEPPPLSVSSPFPPRKVRVRYERLASPGEGFEVDLHGGERLFGAQMGKNGDVFVFIESVGD